MMRIPDLRLLVTAKAPVPGITKTRLAHAIGDLAAAEMAAAALLDTLDTCTAAVGAAYCHLALAGDLDEAIASAEIRDRLAGWSVRPQHGTTFAERLVNAHLDVVGPRVQLGMDTPQVAVAHLDEIGGLLLDHDAALGPARDGGWWGFAALGGETARALAGVEMSRPTTYVDTLRVLRAVGWSVGRASTLRDLDEIDDLGPVAASASEGRFRQAARRLETSGAMS